MRSCQPSNIWDILSVLPVTNGSCSLLSSTVSLSSFEHKYLSGVPLSMCGYMCFIYSLAHAAIVCLCVWECCVSVCWGAGQVFDSYACGIHSRQPPAALAAETNCCGPYLPGFTAEALSWGQSGIFIKQACPIIVQQGLADEINARTSHKPNQAPWSLYLCQGRRAQFPASGPSPLLPTPELAIF